jgi:hypothetical protein
MDRAPARIRSGPNSPGSTRISSSSICPPNSSATLIYIKLQSFNGFGGVAGGVQDLATCTAYTYTPTGAGFGGGSGGVPTTPTGLSASPQTGYNAISWAANPASDNVQRYDERLGGDRRDTAEADARRFRRDRDRARQRYGPGDDQRLGRSCLHEDVFNTVNGYQFFWPPADMPDDRAERGADLCARRRAGKRAGDERHALFRELF